MTNDFLWKKVEISDLSILKSFYENYEFSSCDFNPVNTILFAKKYSTSICSKNGILYRFLNSKDKTRNGFLFPVFENLKNDRIKESLEEIIENARLFKTEPSLVLIDENQKKIFDDFLNTNPSFKIFWESDDGNSDYIYKREKLVSLSGKKLQKKKNHINQFLRKYENDCDFSFIESDSFNSECKKKIQEVYSEWKENHLAYFSENITEDILIEENALNIALENFKLFDFKALVLSVKNKSVAFSLGNKINSSFFDVIFEKSVQDFAKDGSYAVINKKFADSVKEPFLNREEDLNIPGLRKAKLSYQPEIILKKYSGRIIKI